MATKAPWSPKFTRLEDQGVVSWETSRKIRGQGTQYIEVQWNRGYSPKLKAWALNAAEHISSWSKAARAYVGSDMLHGYYRDELGYGPNRVERVTLDENGEIHQIMLAFSRSYAVVLVTFQEGKPVDFASVG